jgi:aminoglycoside phosphotransferase (APT) family kinase protein
LSLGLGRPCNLEEIKGGGYNRIIGVNFDIESNVPPCILRIPLDETEFSESNEITDQVAVLRFLHQHSLPVPQVWTYDVTADNAIGSRYVLQTRMPGAPLSDIYDDLSTEEKRQIVDQWVDLLVKIESIKFPTAGRLVAATPSKPCANSTLQGIEIIGFGTSQFEGDHNAVETNPATSLVELLFSQFEAWKQHDVNPSIDRGTSTLWAQIIEIAKEMDSLQLLGSVNDNENVLYHWDLASRNILVEQRLGNWEITAVLDWDGALSVPPVLARKPPIWLWDFSDDPSDWDGDVDIYIPEGQPCIDHTLKEQFHEKIGKHLSTYIEDAYENGRWIRRLARFALYGFRTSEDFQRCNTFVRDWRAKIDGNV